MKIPNYLRVSLRDLFWLILVVGMGLGWYRDHSRISDVHSFLEMFDMVAADTDPTGFTKHMERLGKPYVVTVAPRAATKSPNSPNP